MNPCGSASFAPAEAPSIRPARKGTLPPACDQTKRMSGKRAASPLNATPMIARVVSVTYSMLPGPTPGAYSSVLQQSAAVGCTATTALRRFNSSLTGGNAGFPRQSSPLLLGDPTP